MPAYNYSNISAETTLTSGISASSTVIALNSTSGLPVSFPFTLILDYGQANVEVVSVTALNGTNYTVTRGEDGTAAQSHNPGARVVHGVVARDLKQPQDHIAASTGVHGAAGSVVGTTDVQTLSNKTINGASNTLTVRDADITGLAASKLTGNFNGGSSFVSAADATVPLTAKGTATATGNLFELYKGVTNQFTVSAAGGLTAGGGLAAAGSVDATAATAATNAYTAKVTGDANSRLTVLADGTLKWGNGTAVTDATLARTAAGVLAVTGTLTVSASPAGTSDVTTKAYVDAVQVGPTRCTSTTRPAGASLVLPRIYETDTQFELRWNGTKYIRDPVKARATSAANFVNTTAPAAVAGMTIPLEINSVYEWDLFAPVFGLQNTGCVVWLQLPASATLDAYVSGWRDDTGAFQGSSVMGGTGNVQLGLVGYGYNGSANKSALIARGMVTTGATAGNAVILGAQRIANAGSASVIDLGTWMELRQVA